MERSFTMLNRSNNNLPTLLSLAKLTPESKLRCGVNILEHRNSIPRCKPLVQSITLKSLSLKAKEREKQPTEHLKAPLKGISIKPILHASILKFPISPNEILNIMPELPEWCLKEITSFKELYFLAKELKGKFADFEDEKGDYKVLIGDDIFYRFEIQDILGKGCFGQVLRVYDHLKKKTSALKIIKNRQRHPDQAQTEIEILQVFKQQSSSGSNYIIQLEEHFKFRGYIMLVFEILGMNLYELMKRNSFRGLSNNLIKRISKQVLHSLSVLSKQHIIHCDLKPENILLNDSSLSAVKLIDFGSSCYLNKTIFTYIQSRFYRAPEVVLGVPYNTAIDIWSFGCILIELYTGIPIFASESEQDLVVKIVEVLGDPPVELLAQGSRSYLFFTPNGKVKPEINKVKANPGQRTVRDVLKGADEGFVMLVEGCLKWNPSQRISPRQGLKSIWLETEEKDRNSAKKKCQIRIEDITKNTPNLQRFIDRRNNTLK